LGFIIKQLQMTGSARHEEVDHPFGFGFEVRLLGSERVLSGSGNGLQKRAQGDGAQAHTAFFEEPAPRNNARILVAIALSLEKSLAVHREGITERGFILS
jgi:hypothetical protein